MSARSVWTRQLPVQVPLGPRDFRAVQPAETRTLMPRAPNRSADSTAFRIARLNATRFSNCIATDSEMSCASSSGFWIS
jgi:hypothetical protein